MYPKKRRSRLQKHKRAAEIRGLIWLVTYGKMQAVEATRLIDFGAHDPKTIKRYADEFRENNFDRLRLWHVKDKEVPQILEHFHYNLKKDEQWEDLNNMPKEAIKLTGFSYKFCPPETRQNPDERKFEGANGGFVKTASKRCGCPHHGGQYSVIKIDTKRSREIKQAKKMKRLIQQQQQQILQTTNVENNE